MFNFVPSCPPFHPKVPDYSDLVYGTWRYTNPGTGVTYEVAVQSLGKDAGCSTVAQIFLVVWNEFWWSHPDDTWYEKGFIRVNTCYPLRTVRKYPLICADPILLQKLRKAATCKRPTQQVPALLGKTCIRIDAGQAILEWNMKTVLESQSRAAKKSDKKEPSLPTRMARVVKAMFKRRVAPQ